MKNALAREDVTLAAADSLRMRGTNLGSRGRPGMTREALLPEQQRVRDGRRRARRRAFAAPGTLWQPDETGSDEDAIRGRGDMTLPATAHRTVHRRLPMG